MSLIIKTKAEIKAEKKAQEKERAREEAKRYLAETDWMVVREAETGKAMPQSISAARAKARRDAGQ